MFDRRRLAKDIDLQYVETKYVVSKVVFMEKGDLGCLKLKIRKIIC